ncbi:hypothetical protein AAZX31_01G064900 [Glycine max]
MKIECWECEMSLKCQRFLPIDCWCRTKGYNFV